MRRKENLVNPVKYFSLQIAPVFFHSYPTSACTARVKQKCLVSEGKYNIGIYATQPPDMPHGACEWLPPSMQNVEYNAPLISGHLIVKRT